MDPRAAFDRLREISARLRTSWPHAREISAGVSNDPKPASPQGVQVRIGGAILGERPPVQ